MTKPRKKRRSANLRQCVENIQRITQRKSDRVAKAVLISVRCKPMPDLPKTPRRPAKQTPEGTDPDRYVGYTAVGHQKMRGSSTIPRGVY